MIKVNQYSIDLKIEDFELPYGSIDEIILTEELDGTLPKVQVTLVLTQFDSFLRIINKINTKFDIGIGTEEDNLEYNKYIISDYLMKRDGQQYYFTLYGIPDLKEYTNEPRIRSFKDKTSADVLGEISSLTPVVDHNADDSQIWIQHNCPDKEFVRRVIEHSYVSDEDAVVHAVNFKKELIVKSLKDAFKAEPSITLSNNGKDPEVQFNSYKLETNASLFQYLFSEGASQSVVHIDQPNPEIISIDESSAINNESYNLQSTNKNFPTIIDCRNVHDKYYYASVNNLKKKMNLVSKFLVFNLPDMTWKEDELTLLDSVKVIEKYDGIATLMTGIYLVVKKSMHITGDAISTELILARDFYSE